MSETTAIGFTHKDILELLLKKQKIHEGIWALRVKFGLNATNIGPSETDLNPAAIVAVVEIGIQKGEKESSIAVDAAKINPRPAKRVRK